MARTDLIGTWDFMGIVAPSFDNWRRFTFDTSSPLETILVKCLSVPELPVTVGYLRAVFFTPDPIYSPWLKFFPKEIAELYTIPIPPEIINNVDGIRRGFEVIKKPKRRPTYGITPNNGWSVSLEVLSKAGIGTGGGSDTVDDDTPVPSNPLTPSSIIDLLG
ncbi:MAG: hypothetical protein HC799_16165 [Limnothrix sp. RL_2_0]|nr:hypothetical protein [Limnothrix sp. RL_2_0]